LPYPRNSRYGKHLEFNALALNGLHYNIHTMDELDFELIDESGDGQDETTIETNEGTDTSANAKQDSEDNTTSTKSKKSNFKKMSKINKWLKAENAELQKRLKALEVNDIDVDDDEEDYDNYDEVNGFDKTEFRFFTIENPEAKEYRTWMESILEEYPNMSFEDALALVKAKTPKESTSSNDFSSRWSNVKVRKRLADLTDEEALKLPNNKYLEYQRVKGKIR